MHAGKYSFKVDCTQKSGQQMHQHNKCLNTPTDAYRSHRGAVTTKRQSDTGDLLPVINDVLVLSDIVYALTLSLSLSLSHTFHVCCFHCIVLTLQVIRPDSM